ncbi:MAG: tripartite tricarboxylate transporter substrate binding protein, partial [Comamonadaceae bacterium]
LAHFLHDAQARIVEEVRKAMQTDEIKAVWASQGAEFPDYTPQQFASHVNGEIKRWATVVKASGAKFD